MDRETLFSLIFHHRERHSRMLLSSQVMARRKFPKLDMDQLELPSQDMGVELLNQDMDRFRLAIPPRGLRKLAMANRELCSQAMEYRDLMDCKHLLHLFMGHLNKQLVLLCMVHRGRDNPITVQFLLLHFNLVTFREVLPNKHMVSKAQQ